MDFELKKFFDHNAREFALSAREVSTPKEILQQSGLPYLPLLGLNIPYELMLKEALALESVAVPHRYDGEGHRGWRSLVLHGLSSVHTQGAEQYGLDPDDASIYRWTDIERFAPVTTEFFKKSFHYVRYQRLRFMYLEPDGFISPHTDTDRYYLGPVNIALNNPEGCDFVMENVGRLPFAPGTALKLALCNRHAVWNRSSQTRVHMIVHGSPDPAYWNPIYERGYALMRAADEVTA